MRTPLSLLILVALVIPLIIPATATITDNKFPEARVFVTNVVDGDTVDIAPAVKVAGEYRYSVRLADINAPGINTQEGDWSKGNLTQLLASYGGIVYLDIDDEYGTDQYGRIVAVVYVRYNSTHLLNVNKWLVDNGYARIEDFDNEFNPSTWSLYEPYSSSSDNYPTVNDYTVTGYNPGSYSTHGGVSYAVTPDGSYLAFAVAEQYDAANNPAPKVRVMVFNTATGGLETSLTIDQAYNSAINAFQGFIAIAANNTGFLVVWNQYSDTIGTSRSRIVEWAYIGKTSNGWQVTTRGYSYSGSYQFAPMAAYIPSSGNWSVFYVYRTSGGDNRLYVNTHTGGLEVPGYTAGYASLGSNSNVNLSVGVDYYGRLFMDKYTGKMAVVARTWSSSTGYDMGVVVFDPTRAPWGVSVVLIDNRPGDQGPSPVSYSTSYGTVTATNYYFALFGNVHSEALYTRSSTRILAVYNDTSTSLAYFVYDVTTGQTVKGPTTLATGLSSGSSYYPWVIAGKNGWLVIYSDGTGYYNYTYIDKDGNIGSSVALGGNIGWVRGAFDPVNDRFIIVFSSKGPKSDRDIFLVYVDESTGELSKYVVPVANTTNDEYFTLPVYLNDRLYLAFIGGSTHIAVVGSEFYQSPAPIPEPWITGAVALVVVGTVIAFYRSRRKHSS